MFIDAVDYHESIWIDYMKRYLSFWCPFRFIGNLPVVKIIVGKKSFNFNNIVIDYSAKGIYIIK